MKPDEQPEKRTTATRRACSREVQSGEGTADVCDSMMNAEGVQAQLRVREQCGARADPSPTLTPQDGQGDRSSPGVLPEQCALTRAPTKH